MQKLLKHTQNCNNKTKTNKNAFVCLFVASANKIRPRIYILCTNKQQTTNCLLQFTQWKTIQKRLARQTNAQTTKEEQSALHLLECQRSARLSALRCVALEASLTTKPKQRKSNAKEQRSRKQTSLCFLLSANSVCDLELRCFASLCVFRRSNLNVFCVACKSLNFVFVSGVFGSRVLSFGFALFSLQVATCVCLLGAQTEMHCEFAVCSRNAKSQNATLLATAALCSRVQTNRARVRSAAVV